MVKKKLDDYLERGVKRSEGAERRPSEDIEKIASFVAEKTVALMAKGILDELRRLRESVDELKKEVESLKREVVLLRKASALGRRGSEYSSTAGAVEEYLTLVRKKLKERGYVLASEIKSELGVNASIVKKIISNIDNVETIESSGDIVLIDKAALEEFRTRLKTLKTPDPVDASRILGKYGKLFLSLRKGGLIIYDTKGGWRLLEL